MIRCDTGFNVQSRICVDKESTVPEKRRVGW